MNKFEVVEKTEKNSVVIFMKFNAFAKGSALTAGGGMEY